MKKKAGFANARVCPETVPAHGKRGIRMFITNYHTHTMRCHHAVGLDREYVEAAIAAGFSEIGFSDHAPCWFPGDYYSDFRMEREKLPDYMASMLALRQEYAEKIRILIGFELEYYPDCFRKTLDLLAPYPYDYLILGQHVLGNEQGAPASGAPTEDEERLAHYTEQVCEGLNTGKFSYLAHPDLIHFLGDSTVWERYMRKICECANQNEVPLEINFLGLRGHRAYPREEFFRIAGECGCRVVFGSDAHDPHDIGDFASAKIAEEWCRKYHLPVVERPEWKNPRA